MSYDSRQDTIAHKERVRSLLQAIEFELAGRAYRHDSTKLEEPEKALFDEWTPKLKELTYGSDEYKAALAALKPALDHHYAAWSHHPEHFENGINGMSLLDLIEMFCDWRAAGERHADGNFAKSLEINRKRFKMDDQLAGIFENTRKELGW